jgi:hypothetical protein
VADLKTDPPAAPAPGPSRLRLGRWWLALSRERARALLGAGRSWPGRLWRGHRVMVILAGLSLIPRILASLGFRPALLTADSFLYMSNAATNTPGNIRPSGYAALLDLAKILPHPLVAVAAAQHLMGIAVAVIVYALLRSRGLPGWGAALAAAPVLFDVREIALESYILPDTVFCLVVVSAVALLLTRPRPRPGQCAAAALLLAYACLLRGNGLPLAVVAAAFLLVRQVGWRAAGVAAVAFAVPVAGYVGLFHATYGTWSLTSSDGMFLWSRTTSFANCAVLRPPADLRPLCPGRAAGIAVPPAGSTPVTRLLDAPNASDYLWSAQAWWRHDAHPGINRANNRLARQFAEDAIVAQPGSYLRVVARDVLLTFTATDRPQGATAMTFTARPRIPALPGYYQADEQDYAGTSGNTHEVQPWAFWVFLYQQPVVFPGLAFAAAFLIGMAGVARNWRRRGGPAALPWALAAVSIVSPALLTQSLYRYVIVAIPLSCLAAGLAFAEWAQCPAAQCPAAQSPAALCPAAQSPAAQPPTEVQGRERRSAT